MYRQVCGGGGGGVYVEDVFKWCSTVAVAGEEYFSGREQYKRDTLSFLCWNTSI